MNTEDSEFARIEREQAMRGVPDAIHHTDTSEPLMYIQGWNDCRQAMLEQPAQVEVCCGDYGKCMKPCTPRGKWLAEQPAHQCNHCNGSGRMVRDPDIGTDQECFVCDGAGAIKTEQPAPAQQEPVGWQFFQDGKWHNGMETNDHRKHTEAAGVPVRDVYPFPQAQPAREWVGLTVYKVMDILKKCCDEHDFEKDSADLSRSFARAIEAELKENNT